MPVPPLLSYPPVASGPLTRALTDPLVTGSPSLRSTTPVTIVAIPSASTTSRPATRLAAVQRDGLGLRHVERTRVVGRHRLRQLHLDGRLSRVERLGHLRPDLHEVAAGLQPRHAELAKVVCLHLPGRRRPAAARQPQHAHLRRFDGIAVRVEDTARNRRTVIERNGQVFDHLSVTHEERNHPGAHRTIDFGIAGRHVRGLLHHQAVGPCWECRQFERPGRIGEDGSL